MANKYFLTGGTGAIGSALVPLLLAEPGSQIWLLMRAESSSHLQKRFDELMTFWTREENLPQEGHLTQDIKNRIFPLMGDTKHHQFNLSNADYKEITRHCTHIIHCAGVVRMNLPIEEARDHALGSAKNIVELAISCKKSGSLKKLEFVSTVGVAGRMRGPVPESWISQKRTFHNTYEQSKAEAEDYLQEQILAWEIPVTVHRPSMVVGHSRTGNIIHFQIFYFLCEFLSGRRTFGLLPWLGAATLDTVPVDYVAETIHWSSAREDTKNKIFHLCSGPDQAIKLIRLQQLLKRSFQKRKLKSPITLFLPVSLYRKLVHWAKSHGPGRLRKFSKVIEVFVEYLLDNQEFNNKETLLFLKEKGGPLLTKPDDYLPRVLDFYWDKRDD